MLLGELQRNTNSIDGTRSAGEAPGINLESVERIGRVAAPLAQEEDGLDLGEVPVSLDVLGQIDLARVEDLVVQLARRRGRAVPRNLTQLDWGDIEEAWCAHARSVLS